MTLRTPELREARKVIADHNKQQRRERKARAIEGVKARALSPAPGQREPRQRDNGYLAFLRRLPCAVCGSTPSDAAHTRFSNPKVGRVNPGLQQKPHDRFATPLCRRSHEEQHAAGNEAAWWASHGIDPDALSASLYAAYLSGQDGAPVVARFSAGAGR